MFTQRFPRGLSLVELLIVIAIISILLQLTLPAIESSREAARRATCQNNLRQIGLAAMGHESALHCLPTAGWGWGWMGDPDRGTGKSQSGSWAYQLLPYMEEEGVYNIGRGIAGEAKYNALTVLAATPVTPFYCPSRRLPRATPNTYEPVEHAGFERGDLFWYNAKKAEKLARTDYAANVGDKWVFWHEGPSPEDADKGKGFLAFRDFEDKQDLTIADVTGVVVQRQPISLQQVLDGTSKTYFAGEKWILVDDYKTGRWLGDDQSCWVGDDWDTVASTEFQPRRDFSLSEAPNENIYKMPFGSSHQGGFQMLLCDGSVQTMNYDVDSDVHRRFGNRRDNEMTRPIQP